MSRKKIHGWKDKGIYKLLLYQEQEQKRNSRDPLPDRYGEIANTDVEKADTFTPYYYSAVRKRQDDPFVSHKDDELLFSPLITKEHARQCLNEET